MEKVSEERKMKNKVKKEARINFQYLLQYDIEERNPGCEGCSGDRSDYCRCSVIDDVEINEKKLDHLPIAEYFIDWVGEKNKTDSTNVCLLYCMDRIFRHANLMQESFEWVSENGYYGQELQGIYLTEDLERAMRNHYDELIASHTITDKINYVLTNEYGFLLPRIKGLNWYFMSVYVKDIIIPNVDYYTKKLDKNLISYYKDWKLPICLIDENNKLIDGYHRYTANSNLEMMSVLKLDK